MTFLLEWLPKSLEFWHCGNWYKKKYSTGGNILGRDQSVWKYRGMDGGMNHVRGIIGSLRFEEYQETVGH